MATLLGPLGQGEIHQVARVSRLCWESWSSQPPYAAEPFSTQIVRRPCCRWPKGFSLSMASTFPVNRPGDPTQVLTPKVPCLRRGTPYQSGATDPQPRRSLVSPRGTRGAPPSCSRQRNGRQNRTRTRTRTLVLEHGAFALTVYHAPGMAPSGSSPRFPRYVGLQ